jgi:ZIP family zinc transporter
MLDLHMSVIVFLSVAAFASAFLGGLFALRFKDKLHLVMGFSAGALIGVVLFDLLPEAIEMSGEVHFVTMIAALGFAVYLILDRLLVLHFDTGEEAHPNRGRLGAGSVFVHSFLDGAALGVALQVSVLATAAVAIAVFTHRFSDGINTVSLILKSTASRKEAMNWLWGVSLAPVLGIFAGRLVTLPESILGIALSVFAGFFFYIGASELLPESHHHHRTVWTTLATLGGMALLYIIVSVAHV